MITISLCMIVKNEEQLLSRCLDSVLGAVDEIILVDTGSTDRTREIAHSYTPHVYDFPWQNDFSAARNFAYSKASKDYQLWLDADDVLPPEDLHKLLSLKETLPKGTDMVTMRYHTHFDETGAPVFTSTRERLTKTEKAFRWQDPVHECIPLEGKLYHSDIAISHQKPPSAEVSIRNLEIYEALESQAHTFTPRQQYYFARELLDHGNFQKSAQYFAAFLNGGKGWLEDNIAACRALAHCHHALGQEENVLPLLLQSFQYDRPRGETCCEIGYHYSRTGQYDTALHWFQIAANLLPPSGYGFVQPDYWSFIPQVESCVCACHLGDFQAAWRYHKAAASHKPQHPTVAQNKAYLQSVLPHRDEESSGENAPPP